MNPPSTGIARPFIIADASLSRKMIISAISPVSANRPIGMRLRTGPAGRVLLHLGHAWYPLEGYELQGLPSDEFLNRLVAVSKESFSEIVYGNAARNLLQSIDGIGGEVDD